VPQHCAEVVHCCPYWEHVVPPPPVGPPLLPVPLSVPPPVGPDEPQVPLVDPAPITHGSPAQQSAVVVHVEPVG
jgi:hypothetical protein